MKEYSLDSIAQNASTIGFRFYETLNQSIPSEGMFIDSFNISNEGEPLAAWFHGNASGQYSVYADGTLIVPVDVSGLSAPLELNYWANWDIQGGNYDNLVVMISQDNGSSWTIMSRYPAYLHGILMVVRHTISNHTGGEKYCILSSLGSRSCKCLKHFTEIQVTTDGSVNMVVVQSMAGKG